MGIEHESVVDQPLAEVFAGIPPARFGGLTSWRRESSAGDGGTRVSDHVGTSAPGVAMRSTFTAPPMVVAVTRLNEPERQWNPDRPAPHLLSGVYAVVHLATTGRPSSSGATFFWPTWWRNGWGRRHRRVHAVRTGIVQSARGGIKRTCSTCTTGRWMTVG
jgi:hypothetical protein